MSAGGEFFRWMRLRWRGLFQRRHHEAALDREMQFHLDMLIEENVAAGMSLEEARFAAQREFGGAGHYREECRDTWRSAIVSGLLSDFAFGARALRRSPGFTAVAVFTLALGIGVNAITFSFARDIVLRPAARDRELNLAALYNGRDGAEGNFRFFSHAEFEALDASTEVFADVAAMGIQNAAIGVGQTLQRRLVGVVSENYFSLLGVRPAQGRFFTAEEARPGASIPVLVANHALWERLGRPANFVGSELRVEDRVYTVIGVTPPAFVGLHISIGPDAWLPLGAPLAGWDLRKSTATHFNLFARVQPELSLASAASRLEAADRRLNALPPADRSGARRVVLAAPSRINFGTVSPDHEAPLSLYAGLAVGLSLTVLLVACLNLANLLHARGVARQKEIAIRFALGASRWRVIRGLLAEGLLLALLGGSLSLVLGLWTDDLLARWNHEAFASSGFAFGLPAFLDASVVLATLGFSLLATLAFSLWPALRITRPDLFPDLKQIAGAPPTAGRWNRIFSLGQVPLLAQIALSLALIFSAVLFVRGAKNAQSLDLGFRPDQQLVGQLDYTFARLDRDQLRARQQAVLASAIALPGVSAAALASNVPYNFELPNHAFRSADDAATNTSDPSRGRHWAGYTAVTRGYFAQLGITLLRGRDFTLEESSGTSARPVAVIDETLARALFGDADALGRSLVPDRQPAGAAAIEIVGIVRSPRNDVFADLPRRIYRPLGQSSENKVYLHVRVPEPLALVDTLRRHLQTVEPSARIFSVRPFAQFVEQNINVLLIRTMGLVFGFFGGIALVLAIVGVYGVKAHAVARRTREIGVRVALGARPRDIMTLILKQSAIQGGIGLALGFGCALAAGRGLSAMLYRVDPADPLALVASVVLLGAAILFASWFPARRAMKVDPLVAIRTE